MRTPEAIMAVARELGVFFLGPDSEWLWTAVTGVVTAVTFVAIYRQLRLQASQAARDQLLALDAQWSSELMLRFRVRVYQAWLDETLDWSTAGWGDTCSHWELVGGLVRSKDMHLRVIMTVIEGEVTWWWSVVGPSMLAAREEFAEPKAGADFEWLTVQVLKSGGSAALPPTRDAVQGALSRILERIAILEAVRR